MTNIKNYLNNMTLTIVFLLAQFGLTNAISKEHVFSGFRNKIQNDILKKLIECETCLGFWVGCLLWWILPPITNIEFCNIIVAGLISSAFNKILLITLYKWYNTIK